MASIIEHAAQLTQCKMCHRWEGSMLLCGVSFPAEAGDCKEFTPIKLVKRPSLSAAFFSITPSDDSTASYYELPAGATQLQNLISHRNMNAQMGEIFRAAYRYGLASHSDQLRDAKKIKFYIEAEIARLQKLGGV